MQLSDYRYTAAPEKDSITIYIGEEAIEVKLIIIKEPK